MTPPAPLLLLAGACASVPHPAPETAGDRDFLQRCSESAGWNFTYPEALGGELGRVRLAPFHPLSVPDQRFGQELDRALSGSGLDSRPVGPAELRTLVIRRAG